MKSRVCWLVTLALLFPTLGCAGGWRNGAPPQTATSAAAGPMAKAIPAANGGAVSGTHVTPDGVVFAYAGAATSVNVAGEFNSWSTSADALTKQGDGTWSLKKKLTPGRYLYKLVLDGGTWKEDPSAKETADDGYGGKNSVVVVSGAAAAAAPAPPASQAAAATGDGVVFRYSGAATSVNLAGEFNSWSTSADALTKQADGSWTITKKLSAGRYTYKFVVDGGTWKEDPSAKESVDDGFGGKNSVVVVGGTAAAAAPAVAAPTMAATPAATPAATGDGVVFRYSGAATSVNLAGEFNSWSTSADALTKQADGSWTITKKLSAGRYTYKFVIDGGTWKEDPSAKESIDDGFGGKNSVVVVGTGATSVAAAAPGAAAAPAAAKPVTGKARAPQITSKGVVFTYAGAARSVALCGSFNQWAPNADPMQQQADGTWTLTKKLPAGAHTYKFLVDGTQWKTDDANAEGQDDGFGGKNSLITVK